MLIISPLSPAETEINTLVFFELPPVPDRPLASASHCNISSLCYIKRLLVFIKKNSYRSLCATFKFIELAVA